MKHKFRTEWAGMQHTYEKRSIVLNGVTLETVKTYNRDCECVDTLSTAKSSEVWNVKRTDIAGCATFIKRVADPVFLWRAVSL